MRDHVSAGRHSGLDLKSYNLQFLPENFLSLLALGLVLAQLDRLAPVNANNVVVCPLLWRSYEAQHLEQR